ncbi:flagellar hook capping protein [Caulobacter zeae]|jgi:flagellar basal-body rod modification protein FlgD|uniref:Basal-body rod modification protein FlgD n=3 Tax=Caulobacter TaxID=75 RepID=A0A2T9JRE2_9CAUL|nr:MULTISPECIES: flagellar hook capping FlgD N-terminal domain-containing protein [Caulobacter]MDG2530044.1 flagellar hook capping FlgD N-terminal domain-containing protein [Caulobacter endophyticus]NGM49674.1 flagellar hook capping protein [Caulobacter sp. 602-2]PLR20138.1 flagellar hook capping protein [Caulobacter zeae]PVM80928.1 flagellar hook capping protein [Caulobacter radicis]PVM86270.1 flagellar hook capping protein [Caulobacter radicis]
MTTVSSATSTSTTSSSSSSGTLQLGTTDFLKLLMTQLTNQNPLDPTDPTEFTSQLATYSSLEQQINMNDTLTTMSDNMSSLLTQVQLLASASE